MIQYDKKSKIGRDHGYGAWSDSTYLRFDPEDLKLLKKLKSSKIESAYIDTILVWKEKDNVIPPEYIATLLQFMSKLVEFTPEFIEKYNVKQYHINLIRRTYFNYENWDEENMAMMGYKRPYGNSNVLQDVFEEYEKIVGKVISFDEIPKDYIEKQTEYYDDFNDDIKSDIVDEYISEKWIEENNDMLLNIHNEVMYIIDAMTHELELNSLEWTSDNSWTVSWNINWTPTEKGKAQYNSLKREVKLKRILKD